jgi:hypothetical protein
MLIRMISVDPDPAFHFDAAPGPDPDLDDTV